MSRLITRIIFVSSVLFASQSSASNLELAGSYTINADHSIWKTDKEIIFTRWDQARNGHELVALDPISGNERVIAHNEHGEIVFVDKNDEFWLVQKYRFDRAAGSLSLIKNNDMSVVGSIRLRSLSSKGFIFSDRIIIVQGGASSMCAWRESGSWCEPARYALTLSFPDLKFQKSNTVYGLGKIEKIPQGYASLGIFNVYVYGDSFDNFQEAAIPRQVKFGPGSTCSEHVVLKSAETGLVFGGCDSVYKFDYSSRAVSKTAALEGEYVYASDGRKVYAIPKDGAKNAASKIIDMSDWSVSEDVAMSGVLALVSGQYLVIASHPEYGKVSVKYFKIGSSAPNHSLQARPP